ncbi:MAG: alpha/beta fold hydrolase [Magnetovibrionaceae bacterium]
MATPQIPSPGSPANFRASYQECRYTAQDGLSLYYRRYGKAVHDRPALLCLGGLTRNSKDFHLLAKRYMDRTLVLCPDYRGRGRSDYAPTSASYRPEAYLDDLRHLFVVEAVHRVVVIGTSLGGLLAMGLGVSQPTVIAGALLNDVGPDLHFPALRSVMSFMRRTEPLATWADAAGLLKEYFPDFPAGTDEIWEAIARATWQETPRGLVFDWDPKILEPVEADPEPDIDLWPLFRSLGGRPLVSVRGGKSDLFTAEAQAAMAAAHPGLVTVTVEGVGHAPSLGEREVLEVLDALVDQAR